MAVLSLWALYAVAMNVFLKTSLFDKVLNGDPDTIAIHYSSGWSAIPGRIHARDLSIRGRDSNVEWILKLDEADFDMSFVALFERRFHVRRVHGAGISFRVRQRLDAPPSTPEQIADAQDLAPIDGLPPWSLPPAHSRAARRACEVSPTSVATRPTGSGR